MALITCNALCLGYDGRAILKDMSFSVEEGDYLCIVGENGSGKSTLMRTMLGLQKPLSGAVTLGGGLDRGGIGYLPQQSDVQRDFPATVWEVALTGCQARMRKGAFYSKADKERTRASLRRMGVESLAGRGFSELSGGQRQRVLLARALCATEALLLLDEPVSGLDPDATRDMYALVEGLNREGTAIVMISHDVDAARRYASRILSIGQGGYSIQGNKGGDAA